ncbi:MAG TPA: hypothetical protein VGU45_08010 [Microvirga sp.]|jgi:hypothetical protein|nr:hypothetical protein [Microvirga sp.]
MVARPPKIGASDVDGARKLNEVAAAQDEAAAKLAEQARELEGDSHLAKAKALTRAARHKRVLSLKARAVAASKDVL